MINPVDYTNLGVPIEGSVPIKGIKSALFRLSEDISAEFREYLEKNDIDSTGALANAIGGVPVKIFDDGAEIKIEALDYFKFIDQGVDAAPQSDDPDKVVQGSPFQFKSIKPPSIEGIDSIRIFVGAKGIPAVPDIDSITYAIAVSVKKKGIKAKNIIDGVFKEGLLDRMADSLANALGTSVVLTFEQNFKQWQ